MEKRTFLKFGFSLACTEIGYFVSMFAYYLLLDPLILQYFSFNEDLGKAISTVLSSGILYSTMILIIWLFMRGLPAGSLKPKSSIPFSMFIVLFLICQGVGYLLAIGGYYVNFYFEAGLYDILSPIFHFPAPIPEPESATGLAHIAEVFATIVMAPVCEEYIFRKLLLDKLRPFGDTIAIVLTSLAFGLTHLNFNQFFFAAFVGLVFGYVVIRTGRLSYSIALHFMYNSMSAIVIPFLYNLDDRFALLGTLLVSGIYYALMVIGAAIFFSSFKKIKLEKSQYRFSRPIGGGLIVGNAGVIIYLIICALLFVFTSYLNLINGYYELP